MTLNNPHGNALLRDEHSATNPVRLTQAVYTSLKLM